jgi:hypothetical protein
LSQWLISHSCIWTHCKWFSPWGRNVEVIWSFQGNIYHAHEHLCVANSVSVPIATWSLTHQRRIVVSWKLPNA